MAISEDTRAIVAASLTAAHCSLTGPQQGGSEASAAQTRSTILEIYQGYARSLGLGVAVGSSRMAVDKSAAN